MQIRTDNFIFEISGDYGPHLIVGLLLIVAASLCRRWWSDGWEKWTKVFNVVEPSLSCSPSAIDVTSTGMGGLIAAIVNFPLTIIFTILAVDQVVFVGWLWEQIVTWLMARTPLI